MNGDIMRKLLMTIKQHFFRDKVSRLLFSVSILFLAALIVSQICLKCGSTREMFTSIEKYENISYASNNAVKQGYVSIKLTSGKPSENIEILFNGEKAGLLDAKSKKIFIDCSGVVEIKNDSGAKIFVTADRASENAELLMNNRVEMSSGIRVLCSVSLKNN